ncbi:tRNA1(Val) (adenine(37)-N6)-methyltransferase [Apilactobacillus apisilvae]|uniref:tRNA1(Val) (Adenine(37)-N6)-methyltransferase n=1 Tax=Apilactobacillus apisilvae TaxID=2923364 RepID=A0ABY4PI77_9LACO|nr:tRNA1(Val) (adenine(37)-N6)-methyltransferase [Apilactobacillus apisilvae]UQS85489.1 tRNA1(Val) (adenine(37)-N6)-methyltransferase [Apilactobacillus apisilvae]
MNELLHDNERIDQLYSNDIKIIQNPNVFSFSLDAVLLANFAKLPFKQQSKAVDLCSGNGAVGMFMSHKTKGEIIEVELQDKLADMAKRSIILNGLQKHVKIINDDLSNFKKYLNKDSIDVITCNPPYFPNLETSKKNPNKYLAVARHEITTNLGEIMSASSELLKTHAKIFLVYRPDRLTELMESMLKYGIAPKKLQFIYPRKNKDSNMVLVEGINRGKKSGMKILPPIFTYKDDTNDYSDFIREILYGK